MFGLPDESQIESLDVVGQLFLIACYGFILLKAAQYIGDGSEKLLLLYGPGLIGGLIIPILGAIPDGAIVLVSGLGSCAQSQVSVGVGTLAGSTIMVLTIPWAASIFLGYRDLDPVTKRAASYPNGRPKHENGFTLTKSVVTAYSNIPWAAKIMMMTSIPYLFVAIPAIIWKGSSKAEQHEHWPAFIGMIVCALVFVCYSIYQIVDSHAQTQQEMKQQKLKFIRWRDTIGAKFGQTDTAIRTVFDRFDEDGNGKIDRNELYNGFLAMGLECTRQQIFKVMEELNTDEDKDTLTFEEFKFAIQKWSRSMPTHANLPDEEQKELETIPASTDEDDEQKNQSSPLLSGDPKKSYQTQGTTSDTTSQQIAVDDKGDKGDKMLEEMWNEEFIEEAEEEEKHLELSDHQLLMVALGDLLIGTLLVTIFSDPMVDAISAFSDTINVSSFYVSFLITPIASNSSELYSALLFARKRTSETISLSFSTLYGAVCMNNTFVLCIFCALIFFKNLQWTFLVETLVILLTIIVVGIMGLRETVYVWQGFLAICLFPLALILVASLDSVLDDSTSSTC